MYFTRIKEAGMDKIYSHKISIFLLVFLLMCMTGSVFASNAKVQKKSPAIVIASFGTTDERALQAILDMVKDVNKAFPHTEVRLAFTSNIIRKIWHKRDKDADYRNSHKDIPEIVYKVKNALGALADLQNEGYQTIVVQPLHVYLGEEFHDLKSYVRALNNINTMKRKWKPFDVIVTGRPLTGVVGVKYPYVEDLERLAKALKKDVALAKKNRSALVYMGHGNEHFSTGVYMELEDIMNKMYPDVKTYIGVVEGFPGYDYLLKKLKNDKVSKITIKPLMFVAGDHAVNDMAGEEDDAWKAMLEKENFRVIPVLKGLGESPEIRKIFLENLKDAAEERHIGLK